MQSGVLLAQEPLVHVSEQLVKIRSQRGRKKERNRFRLLISLSYLTIFWEIVFTVTLIRRGVHTDNATALTKEI